MNFKSILDNHKDLRVRQTLYKRQFEQVIDRKVVEYDMKMKEKQDMTQNNRQSESRRKRRELEDKERQMRTTISKDLVIYINDHMMFIEFDTAARERGIQIVYELARATMEIEIRIGQVNNKIVLIL